MPIDPNFNQEDRDKRLADLIRLVNKLEERVKKQETMFTTMPGDYPIDTILGVKAEGKVVALTVAEVKTLLGIA